MARFEFAYFFALALALLFYNADAAPVGQSVQNGQSGNATCNIDRLETVVGLEKSATLIQKAIDATGSNDTAVVSQLQTAASGIKSAQAGVNTILQALVTGQTAPAGGRQQVGDGIDAASGALNLALANSTTPASSADIASALSAVVGTLSAGIRVVSDCP